MKKIIEKKTSNSLFILLDSIDENEFYRLKRYIYADFFNTNQRLREIFGAIWAAKTGNISYQDMDIKALYQAVCPNRSLRMMNNDYSDLLKLVHRFIAQEEYQNDGLAETRYLLKGLENRKVFKKFKRLINRESKGYEHGDVKRTEYQEIYLQDLLIAEQKYKHYNIHENRKASTNRMLQEFVDSIDRFHALIKIRFLGVMKRRNILLGHQFKYRSITAVKEIVKDMSPDSFPLLSIYYNMYLLWEKESLEQFDICEGILSKHKERFSLYEQKQLFQILINYCRFNVLGEQPRLWKSRQLVLYRAFFERGFCYTGKSQRKKQISLHHYKNYMQLLIELNEFEQFENLQKQYAPQVFFKNAEQQGFVEQYNTTALYFARYLFYTKEKRVIGQEFAYENALKYIQNMESQLATGKQEYPDLFYKILYEVLLLKIYFAQPKGFSTHRNAFYKYVSNQTRISPVYRQAYLNFATAILKLYRSKHQGVVYVKGEIDGLKIIEREWLVNWVIELIE